MTDTKDKILSVFKYASCNGHGQRGRHGPTIEVIVHVIWCCDGQRTHILSRWLITDFMVKINQYNYIKDNNEGVLFMGILIGIKNGIMCRQLSTQFDI